MVYKLKHNILNYREDFDYMKNFKDMVKVFEKATKKQKENLLNILFFGDIHVEDFKNILKLNYWEMADFLKDFFTKK